VARGFAHVAAPFRIGNQAVDCFAELFGIAGRHGNGFHAVARNTRNGGVKRSVDDRAARRHRFELHQPKGLRIGHRRHREHVGDAHQPDAFAVGH